MKRAVVEVRKLQNSIGRSLIPNYVHFYEKKNPASFFFRTEARIFFYHMHGLTVFLSKLENELLVIIESAFLHELV